MLDGEPLYSSDFEIEFGLPVSVPRSTRGRSAPAAARSAGSTPAGSSRSARRAPAPSPGPACYGQGGRSATVTDANLVLGRLDPDFFLGGRLALDAERSRRARSFGSASGSACADVETAVGDGATSPTRTWPTRSGIVTVEQGHRPARVRARRVRRGRPDARVRARGRASASAGCSCRRHPGLCSAFGALAARLRVDAIRSVYLDAARDDSPSSVDRPLRRARGAGARRISPRRAAREAPRLGARSPALPGPELRAGGAVAGRRARPRSTSQAAYDATGSCTSEFYGYRFDGIPIELVRLSTWLRPARRPTVAPPAGETEARRGPSRRGARSTSPTTGPSRRRRPPRALARRRELPGPGDRRVDGLDGRCCPRLARSGARRSASWSSMTTRRRRAIDPVTLTILRNALRERSAARWA